MKRNPHTAYGKLLLLADAMNCTPSYAASRLRDSRYRDFRGIYDYRTWLMVRRFAKKAHRFYHVLWRLWTGTYSAPCAGFAKLSSN